MQINMFYDRSDKLLLAQKIGNIQGGLKWLCVCVCFFYQGFQNVATSLFLSVSLFNSISPECLLWNVCLQNSKKFYLLSLQNDDDQLVKLGKLCLPKKRVRSI